MRSLTNSLVLAAKSAPLLIGGQAVMEGVMMKSMNHVATAVRKPNGKIKVKHTKHSFLSVKYGLIKIPFVRGVFVLFETLILGLKELNWSTNEAFDEEHEKLTAWEIGFTMAISILFALGLFKLLPLFLANVITKMNDGGNWMLNILDAVIKLTVFVVYLLLIGLMKDIRRLYGYHGAEHKAVNCYEAGRKLTPRNAQTFTRLQPRCGTTFVIYVLFLSIALYLFIPFGSSFLSKFLWRIVLLPVVAGIVYEWIRIAGKYYYKNAFVRWISAPGMAFQRITTREPALRMLEVSIAALDKVLQKEASAKQKAS